MLDWFRQLGRASGNLGRVARRNPVWAVQSLIFSPFRFAGHLLRVLVLMLAVAIVLILGSDALVWYPASPDRQLLFLAGQRPVIAAKLRYYADREFAGRFDSA